MSRVRVEHRDGSIEYLDAESVVTDGAALLVHTNDRRSLRFPLANLTGWDVKAKPDGPWERNLVADGRRRQTTV